MVSNTDGNNVVYITMIYTVFSDISNDICNNALGKEVYTIVAFILTH
jgi:hypothetical protein